LERAPGTRLLVIAPNWIGDALMAAPLMARLKHGAKDTHLCVLAPSAVAGVLRHLSLVDEVIESPWPHGGAQLLSRVAISRRLAKREFDAAIILPNSFKSALVPWFARIPVRIGYLGESRRGVLSRWLPNHNTAMPMREHYLALAELLVPSPPAHPDAIAAPRLHVSPEAIARIRDRFAIDATRPLAVFCPGAEYGPAKRWPAEHFAELAKSLWIRDPTLQIALAGSASDMEAGEAITRLAEAPLILTIGKTSIEDAVALLATADFVISNDSGLMHVAAALDRPQVDLYGSTDPSHTPPQSDKARVLWLHPPCSPCFARVCPLGHMRCLNELTPDLVLAAIDRGPVH
jgi:heptosyltransferase-2